MRGTITGFELTRVEEGRTILDGCGSVFWVQLY